MKSLRPLAVAAAVTTPLLFVTPAEAHDGSHPFKNCTEAKEHGYSNIPEGDEHYAPKLDRDSDGYGCDKHGTLANDGKAGTGHYAEQPVEPTPATTPATDETGEPVTDDLAETGGDSTTPYLAAGGAVLLLGGGLLVLHKRRTS